MSEQTPRYYVMQRAGSNSDPYLILVGLGANPEWYRNIGTFRSLSRAMAYAEIENDAPYGPEEERELNEEPPSFPEPESKVTPENFRGPDVEQEIVITEPVIQSVTSYGDDGPQNFPYEGIAEKVVASVMPFVHNEPQSVVMPAETFETVRPLHERLAEWLPEAMNEFPKGPTMRAIAAKFDVDLKYAREAIAHLDKLPEFTTDKRDDTGSVHIRPAESQFIREDLTPLQEELLGAIISSCDSDGVCRKTPTQLGAMIGRPHAQIVQMAAALKKKNYINGNINPADFWLQPNEE